MSEQGTPPMMSPQGSDPLAELRDIHMPPPVDAWPPAPGWWILAIVGTLAAAAFIWWLWRRWRANRYRREALAELDRLRQQYERDGDPLAWLQQYETLLKRVALSRYPRAQVAPLTGEAWVRFLDRTGGQHEFSLGPGQVLIDGNYRPDAQVDVARLDEIGRTWIKRHGDVADLERAA